MKQMGWLALVALLLSPLLLAGCGLPADAAPRAFDSLAQLVPAEVEQAFFLNFKLDGEAGQQWDRLRSRIEANATGQEALASILSEFKIDRFELDALIPGPVVTGYWGGATYNIIPVSDEAAAREAILDHVRYIEWEEEEVEGRTLHHGRVLRSGQSTEQLAWAVSDGLLYITSRFSSNRYETVVLQVLRSLVTLTEEDSLASLSAWQVLRERLPENPFGVVFLNVAEQNRLNPPPSSDTSLDVVMRSQTEAIALAAIPEERGIRVELVGAWRAALDAPPLLQELVALPAIDPAEWTALPADTAIAAISDNAPFIWPWLSDVFNFQGLDKVRDAVGLDVEADLFGPHGPLTGPFAVAITPPLLDQPVSDDLAAGQLLFLGRDAPQTGVDSVRVAMEGRGVTFGPREVEGVEIQSQVGTELTGYAISYGFDGDTFFFGSSPDIIGVAVAAQRQKEGLIEDGAFQAVMDELPSQPSLVAYLGGEAVHRLYTANLTEQQAQGNEIWHLFEVFQAIGLGLRLEPDRLDGVIYFFVAE